MCGSIRKKERRFLISANDCYLKCEQRTHRIIGRLAIQPWENHICRVCTFCRHTEMHLTFWHSLTVFWYENRAQKKTVKQTNTNLDSTSNSMVSNFFNACPSGFGVFNASERNFPVRFCWHACNWSSSCLRLAKISFNSCNFELRLTRDLISSKDKSFLAPSNASLTEIGFGAAATVFVGAGTARFVAGELSRELVGFNWNAFCPSAIFFFGDSVPASVNLTILGCSDFSLSDSTLRLTTRRVVFLSATLALVAFGTFAKMVGWLIDDALMASPSFSFNNWAALIFCDAVMSLLLPSSSKRIAFLLVFDKSSAAARLRTLKNAAIDGDAIFFDALNAFVSSYFCIHNLWIKKQFLFLLIFVSQKGENFVRLMRASQWCDACLHLYSTKMMATADFPSKYKLSVWFRAVFLLLFVFLRWRCMSCEVGCMTLLEYGEWNAVRCMCDRSLRATNVVIFERSFCVSEFCWICLLIWFEVEEAGNILVC